MASRDPTAVPDSDDSTASRDRLVGLTDAATAISLTLLSLELIPHIDESVSGADLAHALLDFMPHLLAYIISFAAIGRFWDYHRGFFRFIRVANGQVVSINLAFLLCLSMIPTSAALLGTHWDEAVAISVYAVILILATLCLWGLWRYVTLVGFVARERLDGRARDYVDHYMALSILGFALAIPLSFVLPPAALILVLATAALSRNLARAVLQHRDRTTSPD